MTKDQLGNLYGIALLLVVGALASVANFLAANWSLAGKFGVEAGIIFFVFGIIGLILFSEPSNDHY